jgi:hypothetical protein
VLLQGHVEGALRVDFTNWVGDESMPCNCGDIYLVSELKRTELASHLEPSKGCCAIINHFKESISSFFF